MSFNPQYATAKDIERADNLDWFGSSFGTSIAISNAKRMAKAIKSITKLIGRFEAVAERWGHPDILKPFIDRIIELDKSSKWSAAYRGGQHSGKYSMSPGQPYKSDCRVEIIMYNLGFNSGRRG